MGLVFTGGIFNRMATSTSSINWMDPYYSIDSSINTWGENNRKFKRGGVNINGRFRISEEAN
ncbi:MAG: hypothetical protein IPG38_09290 [Chitinophagaceae bacterium]|nr:hypothetical protein [Chitinophagaceae bacterium]